MKRNEIIFKLLKEGFSEKTLVNFSDGQLSTLANTVLSEGITKVSATDKPTQDQLKKEKKPFELYEKKKPTSKQLKALDKNKNGKIDKEDFKLLGNKKKSSKEEVKESGLKGNQYKIDANKNGKIDKEDFKLLKNKKSSSKEEVKEGEKWIQKAIHSSKKGSLKKALGVKKNETIPTGKLKTAAKKSGKLGQRARLAMTLKKLKEHSEAQEWVNSLVENNYHSLTTKNEIMELIKTKLNESETMTSMPNFMSYDSILSAPTKPVTKPKPDTKPVTKPKPKTPFNPGPKVNPGPMAGVNSESAPTKPVTKPKPDTKPVTKPKPKTPFNPGPKVNPGPMAGVNESKLKKK